MEHTNLTMSTSTMTLLFATLAILAAVAAVVLHGVGWRPVHDARPRLLGLAGWQRDAGVRRYVLPLAVIGRAISTYHILVERFPSLESSGVCEVSNPCTIRWVERFGFVTIPTMALAGFACISGLLVYPPQGHRLREPDQRPDRPIASEIRP